MARDESGNYNDGMVNGATLTTDRFGNANSAYSFDGVDDYINAGSHPLSYNYATVSLWIKTIKGTDNYGAFNWSTNDNAGGIGISVGLVSVGDPAEVFSGHFRDTAWTTGYYPRFKGTSNIADDQWHLVTFVYDGDAYLYVDGILEDSILRGSILSNQNQSIYIGHLVNQSVGSYHFNGLIDDVYVYSRALSESEIQALYNE